jgi:transposase
VPVLAKAKTRIGRLWTRVRGDRPFAGPAPPAAAFFYSPDRSGQHPERHLAGYARIMQADAYAGFNRLYEPGRPPGPILEAACWAHVRRKLYELAAVAKAPIAGEAVQRIDRLFAIERDIIGLASEARMAARAQRSAPILAKLEPWLRQQQEQLSRRSEVGRAIAYTTKRWAMLTRFLSDGRICPSTDDDVEKGDCAQLVAFVWSRPAGGRSFHAATIRS